jgi:nucleoside-diphosphate-sugar epimerase
MKIVIIGGTGLIGRKFATKLQAGGHQVVAASPSTGVNSLTGQGQAHPLPRRADRARTGIEQAKADWKAARFDSVPGETEFIPLPGPAPKVVSYP